MYLALKRSQISRAQGLMAPFTTLTLALFSETNPVPVKYALSLLDVMSSCVRLPLVELSNESKASTASVLAHLCERYSEYVIGNPSAADACARQLAGWRDSIAVHRKPARS